MDTFVDSSWYYLRYVNPHYSEGMFDTELTKKWEPVDMYVGGAEHTTMHLLYARFVHKFLRDIGLVSSNEPFQTLRHQGTITNEGAKMSKSKGNVVNPDSFIKEFGSDVFRMYLMFMGPYDLGGDWSDKGIKGVDRFIQKAYLLFDGKEGIKNESPSKEKYDLKDLNEEEKNIYRKVNQTIEKYKSSTDDFRFNTAVAVLMELVNELAKSMDAARKDLMTYVLERFTVMVAPLAPHFGEECWKILGNEKSLFEEPAWFEADPDALTVDSVTVAVQVNGKLRAAIDVPVDSDEAFVKEKAYGDDKVTKHTDGKTVVKEIYVKNKIFNIVVK